MKNKLCSFLSYCLWSEAQDHQVWGPYTYQIECALFKREYHHLKDLIKKMFWRQCTCLWWLANKGAATDALDCWQHYKRVHTAEHKPSRENTPDCLFQVGRENPILAPKILESLYLLLSAYFHFSWCSFSSSTGTFFFFFSPQPASILRLATCSCTLLKAKTTPPRNEDRLCGEETMREPRHSEEEKKEAHVTKERLCSSLERGQWQLQKDTCYKLF